MAGDFSDEEWDISDDQLQVLEHHAIISTQQPQAHNGSSNKTETARNINSNSGSTVRIETPVLQKVVAGGRSRQNVYEQPKSDSFDSPVVDEDGVPLVVEEQKSRVYARPGKPDETTQREQWRKNRFGPTNGPNSNRPAARAIPHHAYQAYQQQIPQYGRQLQQNQTYHGPKTPTGTQLTPSSQAAIQPPPRPFDQGAVNAELAKERREKELLQQKLQSLTTELHTAKGENVVIRSKVVNDAKLAERQLSAAKRQIQEQVTKHQAELESRDAAYNLLTTDHSFVKHELDEQTRRVQSLQRQSREKSGRDGHVEANFSPRKSLHDTLRDGFNDDEILQMSPGRSPARRRTSKPSTPSKKRKQPGNTYEGPSLTLRFSQAQNEQLEPQKEEPTQTKPATKLVKDHQTEEHLKLLQQVLSFRPTDSQYTLVETLVHYSFPRDSSRSLSSLLIFESSKLQGERFPGDLMNIFTQLLNRCIKEEYYQPVKVLLSSLELILDLDPMIVDAEVIQTLLRPLQALAATNARKRWALEKNKVWSEDNPKPEIDIDIDTSACLDLLFTIASLVLDEPGLIRLFWRRMDTELVLIMLAPFQPIADLQLMLELLSTSIQANTFGNICTAEEQSTMETYIVDKICFLLWDPPRHTVKFHPRRQFSNTSLTIEEKYRRLRRPLKDPETEPEPAPARSDICNLRLQVVSLLSSLLTSPTAHPHPHPSNPQTVHHGTKIVLAHPNAIARLVRLLYDEVNLLSSNLPTQCLHAKIVNTTTTILHHVLLSPSATDTKGSFELQRALSGTSIGVYQFRVVLTRIAFREEKALGETDSEAISEESARKATEILEEYVTPDEAVQLVEVLERGEAEGENPVEGYERGLDRMNIEAEEAERAEADVMAGLEL